MDEADESGTSQLHNDTTSGEGDSHRRRLEAAVYFSVSKRSFHPRIESQLHVSAPQQMPGVFG